jgi:hypothetical protein
MKLRRCTRIAVFLGVFAGLFGLAPSVPGWAQATHPPAQKAFSPSLLPDEFRGWQRHGAAVTSKDPAAADPSNIPVLREYRFSDFAAATYTQEDGRTLNVRAARFEDASGAFGAYTFYLQPEMHAEQVGDQGASLPGQRVLFYRGHILVDAHFSQESAMSAAELRELAGLLPRPEGNAANLPSFIAFMPHRGSIANTLKYVVGPAALATVAAPVSADQVDFGASSEVSLGRYDTMSGEATVMVISYPTNQMAGDHWRRLDAALHPGTPQAAGSSPAGSNSGASNTGVTVLGSGTGPGGQIFYKRSGPLLVIASGPSSANDAKSLLNLVNYEASVTWNQATDQHEVKDLYQLVLNIVILCAVLGGFAIVAGVAFGGFRILMKRYFPDRVFDRPEHMEFISLHLGETGAGGGSQSGHEVVRRRPSGPS